MSETLPSTSTLVLIEQVTEGMLALASIWIPICLMYVVRNRPEAGARWLLSLFAAIVLLDGISHELNLLSRTSGEQILGLTVRIVQAGLTLITALILIPVMPRLARVASPTLDVLTGLPNRDNFIDRLDRALRRSLAWGRYGFAVLFIDLDGFKAVNDEFGHHAGDKLLIAVARRLRKTVRDRDIVARYGGDEFTVLLDGVNDRMFAEAAAMRINAALAEPFVIDGVPIRIGASTGISMPAGDDDDAHRVIQEADRAMYRAKSTRPGSYAVSSEVFGSSAAG
jgi:diguanylate cyclase (GGDEF)-like protein